MPESLTRAVRWDTVVGALLVVLLLFSFTFVDGFGNALNLSFLIGNTLPIALIALPMTLLVVSGEIDLSVASTAGLSGAVMGALWNQGMAIEAIIPLCLLLGVVCGLINGLLVTRIGLPSLAVTIGTLAAYRGIAQIVLGSDAVTDFPAQYLDFAAGRLGDTFVPYAFLPFLVLLAIAVVALHATPFGRALFAIGASEEAARFAGIRVKRQKLILFTLTGLMASLTGVFWALHYASARYDNATGLELSVVAAVLLGGIDFDGARDARWCDRRCLPARCAAERHEPPGRLGAVADRRDRCAARSLRPRAPGGAADRRGACSVVRPPGRPRLIAPTRPSRMAIQAPRPFGPPPPTPAEKDPSCVRHPCAAPPPPSPPSPPSPSRSPPAAVPPRRTWPTKAGRPPPPARRTPAPS